MKAFAAALLALTLVACTGTGATPSPAGQAINAVATTTPTISRS